MTTLQGSVPVEKLSQSGVDKSIPTPYNKNVEEDNADIESYYPAYMLANTNPLLNLSVPPPTAGRKAVFQDFYTEIPVLLNKKELVEETIEVK